MLIRALRPCLGADVMARRRGDKPERELCRGPGKLCMALDIDRALNERDMTQGDFVFLPGEDIPEAEIERSKRIGIDYAGEARDYLWRFTVKGDPFVSR